MKKILISLFVFVSLFGVTQKASAILVFNPIYPCCNSNIIRPDYSPTISVIDTFLNNPTEASLKTLCNSSDLISLEDSNKNIKSLCEIVLNGFDKNHMDSYYSYYKWTTYDPSMTLSSADINPPLNDLILVKQIITLYNNTWEAFSSYKLIGYINPYESNLITNSKEAAANFINMGNVSNPADKMYFLLPEKTFSDFRKKLVSDSTPVVTPPQNPVTPVVSPVIEKPLVNEVITPFTKTPTLTQQTISDQQRIKELEARIAKLEASKNVTQIKNNKTTVVSTPATTITNTPSVQKIGWFRRFINWIRN